jgi:hypothetical protein
MKKPRDETEKEFFRYDGIVGATRLACEEGLHPRLFVRFVGLVRTTEKVTAGPRNE